MAAVSAKHTLRLVGVGDPPDMAGCPGPALMLAGDVDAVRAAVSCGFSTPVVVVKAEVYADLAAACEAALLFHGGGEWDAARSQRWKELTGHDEATTRVLCDFTREALRKAGLRP